MPLFNFWSFYCYYSIGVIRSDTDEQLIITVPFSSQVKLRGIRITAAENEGTSGPKEVRVYVNQPNLGFDDADSVKPSKLYNILA